MNIAIHVHFVTFIRRNPAIGIAICLTWQQRLGSYYLAMVPDPELSVSPKQSISKTDKTQAIHGGPATPSLVSQAGDPGP